MWDQRYGDDDYFYGIRPNDFLAENAGRIPAGPVLCLAGLKILHPQELEREVIEGRGHTGTGAVVQLIARRPD